MIEKVLTGIANSKIGKKAYGWACSGNKDYFLNNTLPQVETVLSTACYVWSTSRQKDIDKEQRDLLQIQNIGSGLVGLGVSSWANRKISKAGENIIKDLDPNKIDPKSIRKISMGLRVGLPLATTAVCMRFLIPSFLALFSGKAMDKVREKKNNKLDVIA